MKLADSHPPGTSGVTGPRRVRKDISLREPAAHRTPACTREAGSLCYQVFQVTKNEWLSASAGWLLTKPLRILMIVAVAFLLRYLVRRLINRVTRMPNGGSSKLPALLRPLREKAPEVLGSAVMERRRQRAATIGSVLKSMATFLIYGLAFILVLGELGIDLAPIIASAGIVGVALGFGAQNLVKDFPVRHVHDDRGPVRRR